MLITADPMSKETNIERLKLIQDPFVVIAPSAYRDYPLAQLANELPFIHYSPDSLIGGHTDIIARRLNINLNTQFEFDSTQTLMRFVQANQGWAILSAMCLVRYAELTEGIAVRPLQQGQHCRDIQLIYRPNIHADLPERIAAASAAGLTADVLKKLNKINPALDGQIKSYVPSYTSAQ